MKFTSLTLITILCIFLSSCGEETTDNSTETTDTAAETIPEVVKPSQPTKLLVGLDHLRLRSTPGEKGEEIAYLKKGTILYETGEVSDFTTRIKLRGIWFDEPWIKVKTDKGIEGWVFAGAVLFDMEKPSALTERLLDIRLKSFFGNGLTTELNSYRKRYHSAKTSDDFSNVYRKGEQLRDTMVTILENKIDVMKLDYEQLPDLFWVEEGLPGYETALAAEGTIYYLFKNFKSFQKLAAKTSGKEDDDFVHLNLMVNAQDSIEYFFASWFMQTWDYGGESLLGQGTHFKILKEADKNLKKNDMFLDEVVQIKDRIISDITGKEVSYWEPQQKIQNELDKIIEADLSILTNEDKVAVETRRKMFDNPKGNGIRVNTKSGE